MKVSYKPCVHRHRQRKDKKFSVIIRIGYKSKYSYLETDYLINKTDLNKKLEIKSQLILNKCNAIIAEYSEIIDKINPDKITDVKDVVYYIKKGIKVENDIDFIEFFRNYNKKLEEEKSKSYQLYLTTYNHLCNFTGATSYPIKKITPQFLRDFEAHLRKRDMGTRGLNLYLGRIRAVYNVCMDEYEEYGYTFNYPFSRGTSSGTNKYRMPQVKPAKTVSLTKEQLHAIINIDLSKKIRANRARYAFVVSLFTLGTNATDLYDLDLINNNRLEYKRNKTKDKRTDDAFISIKIEPELKPYLEILKGKDDYIFCFREWYKNKPQFNKGIDKGLEQVVKIINEKYKSDNGNDFIHDFNFYDARRTMASVMRNKLGISKDDVALCLNHVDMAHKTTDHYIETDFSILDRCNRMFIDWLYNE